MVDCGNIYNPSKQLIGKNLIHNYDNIFNIGDINCDPSEIEVYEFCNLYNLTIL